MIFGLLYSYWHINIIAPLLSDFKTFFCQNIQLNRPCSFFSNFKNQTSIYNTLIYYLQLWFYNPNGLTKGKTHFTSLFTLSWIIPLRKFFLYIIAHFFLLPSKDLVAGFYGFIFFPKLNNRQDQNVCCLISTIDEK